MFATAEVVNRKLFWTNPITKFVNISVEPRRIVGVVADVDDESITPRPMLTVYHPLEQESGGGRLFVHASGDPYALVPTITRIVREMAADVPVERPATHDDVRAEVMAPDRLNAIVFGGFAAVAWPCPRCAGRLKLVAWVQDGAVIRRILAHLGLPDALPEMRPW